MWKNGILLEVFFMCVCNYYVTAGQVKAKSPKDWWCDETECFYSDSIPMEEICDNNQSIPYRFNHTTGACELNLKGLLLSFLVINNRLGEVAEEKNRKRTERIFEGVIISGKIFVVFASACAFIGCFYCGWVQYTNHQMRKSVKEVSKRLRAQPLPKKTRPKTRRQENEEIEKTQEAESVAAGVEISVA